MIRELTTCLHAVCMMSEYVMGRRLEHLITQIPRLYLCRTRQQLAQEIGIPFTLLVGRAFTSHQSLLYTRFEITKRDGTVRVIHSPRWPLRNIQKKLANLLTEIYKPSPRATAYLKGRGIKYNASLHLGKRLILNIDLENYFPSIHFGRIRGRLMAEPYRLSNEVATTIARICTLNDRLPIGSPASPVLANIVSSHLDGLLTKLSRENGCFYSRYADDITLSTNRRTLPKSLVVFNSKTQKHEAGSLLVEAIELAGFTVNNKKTRLLDKRSRQEVTGVTINEFPNVNRTFFRDLRGCIHAWERYGRGDAEKFFHEKYNWRKSETLERNLRGRLEHLIHIRGQDDLVVWKLVKRFNGLPERQHSEISYSQPQDLRKRLTETICRVETSDEENQEWRQGSGIKLPNGEVLTNYHNIEILGKVAPSIEIFLKEESQISIHMQLIRHDKAKDIAILEPLDEAWKAAIANGAGELSFENCEIGDQIKVGGYPSYRDGDSCQISSGEVQAFSKIEHIQYFKVSVPIVKGNSGGPVFNNLGQVIGVASRGIDTHDIANAAFNGCLALFRFEKLLRP